MFLRCVFIRRRVTGIFRGLSGNNRRVKKTAILLSVFLVLAAAAILVACDFLSRNLFPESSDVYDEVLRIHIRADSNEEAAQANPEEKNA